ncbi:MAG: site-2 protease family protein [Candidatus Omnitrophica bacterium]|nr:site-2 protease family protein [Candidatus Omnitrophota bacterium]
MSESGAIILSFIQNLPAFLIALVIHEYAHGFVAHKLGDNTAKHMGRLTLNPLAHVDFFGTILLPLFLIISNSPFVFGWAKPVPVNFYNLNNPKKDMIWVGLAGPGANFLTGLIIYLLLVSGIIKSVIIAEFLIKVLLISIFLGGFNLIPIPPLDGSRILLGLLPMKLAKAYSRISPGLGMIILIILFSALRRFF